MKGFLFASNLATPGTLSGAELRNSFGVAIWYQGLEADKKLHGTL